jgi:hypothetical protein
VIERLMPYVLVGVGSFTGGNARLMLARGANADHESPERV